MSLAVGDKLVILDSWVCSAPVYRGEIVTVVANPTPEVIEICDSNGKNWLLHINQLGKGFEIYSRAVADPIVASSKSYTITLPPGVDTFIPKFNSLGAEPIQTSVIDLDWEDYPNLDPDFYKKVARGEA